MEKTIKQFAEELGVTKQTIQYHLRSLPPKHVTKNDKGIILIKSSGQEILSKKISSKTNKENSKETPAEIEFLRNELAIKNEQIKEFQSSQKQLQKLLDQQQILTLQANKKIEQLELQVSDDDETKGQVDQQQPPQAESAPVENKSFFSRLFNR